MTEQNPGNVETLDDIFSTDRDRSADAAALEVQKTSDPNPDPGAQAPKVETQVEVVEEPIQGRDPQSGRFVPVAELVAERKKYQERETAAIQRAQALEERLTQLLTQPQTAAQNAPQQQADPPDFFEDPNSAIQHHLSRVQQQFQSQLLNLSEAQARRSFGSDTVDAAFQAAKASGILRNFVDTSDPYGTLVEWHQREKTLGEVGGDLDSFKKRIEEEVRNKVLAELKGGGAVGAPIAATPQRLPGTLAAATATGQQGGQISPQAMLDDIFATNRDRRSG